MIRRVSISLLAMLFATVWVVGANAQIVRQMSGSAQFAIGDGLPIPKLGSGAIQHVGGKDKPGNAKVTMKGAGASITDKTIILPATQFTLNPGQVNGGNNTPVLMYNAAVFQVYTNLSVFFPKTNQVIAKNGRTGTLATTPTATPTGPGTKIVNYMSWCPGFTATLPTNPSCSAPGSAKAVSVGVCNKASCPTTMAGSMSAPVLLNGRVAYTRTLGQLGGPAKSTLGGTFNVALKVGPNQAAFLGGKPASEAGLGQALGSFVQNFPGPPGPVRANIGYTANGQITNPGAPAPGAATNNTTVSFGGPFTQGKVTIHATKTVGAKGYELFVLYGHDNRNATTGAGNVQLVGGGVSTRTTSGNNANTGTVNFTVPEPGAIAGAAGALLMLAGCHYLVRRRK